MFVLLHSQQFQLEMEQVSWKLKRNGVFFFSPLVLGKALRRGATPSHQVFLGRPYGGWSCEGPYERSFFVWAASLGKILTTDNLIKQGMVMVSCCMCKNSEGPGHLPVHCSFSSCFFGTQKRERNQRILTIQAVSCEDKIDIFLFIVFLSLVF